MSLRVRLALATTAVVAFSVALASIAVYLSMRADLLRNVDDELEHRAIAVQSGVRGTGASQTAMTCRRRGSAQRDYFQIVTAKGVVRPANDEDAIPIDARTLAVASGKGKAFFSALESAGIHARVLTVPIGTNGGASDRQPARQRRPRVASAEADPASRLAGRHGAGGRCAARSSRTRRWWPCAASPTQPSG